MINTEVRKRPVPLDSQAHRGLRLNTRVLPAPARA